MSCVFLIVVFVVTLLGCAPEAPSGTVIHGIVLDGRYESMTPSVAFADPDSIQPVGDPIEDAKIFVETLDPAVEIAARSAPDGRFAVGPIELAEDHMLNAFRSSATATAGCGSSASRPIFLSAGWSSTFPRGSASGRHTDSYPLSPSSNSTFPPLIRARPSAAPIAAYAFRVPAAVAS